MNISCNEINWTDKVHISIKMKWQSERDWEREKKVSELMISNGTKINYNILIES